MLEGMKASPVLYPEFSKLGTPMVVDATSAMGMFPSENYRNTGEDDYTEGLGAKSSLERTLGNEHCYGCPVGCTQVKLARGGNLKFQGSMSDPEYETYYSLGSVCGVKSQEAVIHADHLCDKYGLDTISVGVTIGFAMELFENGLLSKEQVNGLDFRFGNADAMVDAITEIAFRNEGLGELLCDGTKVLAEKIGNGSEKYAMHVKGLEFPAYDPRGAKAHGFNYVTSYTGADHNRGYAPQEIFGSDIPKAYDRFTAEGKGWLTMYNQDLRLATADCPTMCGFLIDMAVASIAEQNTADMVSAATGLEFKKEDIMVIGARVNNVARAFNLTAGLTKADDTLPERVMTETIKEGASKGQSVPKEELDLMLHDYYEARGWSQEGVPTQAKLQELGLDEVAAKLKEKGILS
ncbi:aldehyde ferredoxin oxidoreductase C-terminal domain-containing protein [Alkalibacter rhizosphaerae]|uniref:Aldehyde ferredoxin oxidoreductase C-terminal domain-containing protein n=1 Tax=Alkalibacter rhizosphaerae TaxID=2815577 RepID=A0A974XDC9_9FIRM|nr:aldehyde ferredoxin oxidoreductase C-terminal domain-containing protein [Alkalibacter rhizosphaerae]QSX07767.1 aldehyde ferredoxin oxidoreductase C-terminal domain-containing protein [Alkalibacter rhizosphaerae]